MSARTEEYRLKAENADAEAAQTKDVEARRSYLEIARQWREMAAMAKRNGW